jgi:SAM-dependent methyltransferase
MPNHRPPPVPRVDYDAVAPAFDKRYEHQRYEQVERTVRRFVEMPGGAAVLEVGCGTGHWLASVADLATKVAGVDRSLEMLRRAHSTANAALLVQATAEAIPFGNARFNRVFCVNALHHFPEPVAFLIECRRLLRPGGAFLTIGLDPHAGLDRWWIYEYFPGALAADRRRYLPTPRLREMLVDAGFSAARTEIVQHLPAERTFDVALQRGHLERHSTSQLMVISDAEYEDGIRRLREERPTLRSDLRLYGTVAELLGQ